MTIWSLFSSIWVPTDYRRLNDEILCIDIRRLLLHSVKFDTQSSRTIRRHVLYGFLTSRKHRQMDRPLKFCTGRRSERLKTAVFFLFFFFKFRFQSPRESAVSSGKKGTRSFEQNILLFLRSGPFSSLRRRPATPSTRAS